MNDPVTAAPSRSRGWPAPTRTWLLRMVWEDLLFAHWPCEPAMIQPHLPPGLALDTFDSRAWLGVVPFRITGIRAVPAGDPRFDWLSRVKPADVCGRRRQARRLVLFAGCHQPRGRAHALAVSTTCPIATLGSLAARRPTAGLNTTAAATTIDIRPRSFALDIGR